MLTSENFYNQNVINIFTDASLRKLDFVSYVCAGAVAIIGGNVNNIIDSNFKITVGTNNYGETNGIVLAIDLALKLRILYPNAIFNVFSDSKIALFGIRDWSNAWLNKSLNSPDRVFTNSEGNDVANQELFKQAMYYMKYYNLPINFYHTKGHVGNNQELMSALHLFKLNNGIQISKHVMSIIARMNDIIDNMTRKKLYTENIREIYPCESLYSYYFPANVGDIKTFRNLKNYKGI